MLRRPRMSLTPESMGSPLRTTLEAESKERGGESTPATAATGGAGHASTGEPYLMMTGLAASAIFCARPERTTRRAGGSGCGTEGV